MGIPQQDVLVGATNVVDAGAVQLFAELGGAPLLQIDNPDPADYDDYGSTVAATVDNDIIVSARFLDNLAPDDGSVFVHSGVNGALLWSAANPTADPNGQFGISLASTPQGHVVVGAANDDHGAMNAGRLFVLDGSDGSLIKLIDNPEPDSNVNFGQGLAITPAGQIAVGAFGADGGFGTLTLFTSVSAGESLDPLNNHTFNDANLQACVLNTAAANGWSTVNEVIALDCTSSDITDLTGLDNLTSLQTLDLTDNPDILCTDLDELETALPSTIITRPVPCSSGGGGVQASQVQALHNALGQRVSKTVNGDPNSTIHFLYDQTGQVIAEIDATTGQTLREYLYVNGQQLAIVDNTGTASEATYFVHNDHLGTPQKITDANQQIVWNATYQPFGEVEVTTADIQNNIRFPGQYADEETGLHYNYFRDYDPSLGRYVESDPIGLDGGIDNYSYSINSPIIVTDRSGLIPDHIVRKRNQERIKKYKKYRQDNPKMCGSGWSHYVVPDFLPGTYNFRAACEWHDKCYGCWGKQNGYVQRNQCDDDFHEKAKSSCRGLTYPACIVAAGVYYNTVRSLGRKYFDAGRKNCGCE